MTLFCYVLVTTVVNVLVKTTQKATNHKPVHNESTKL